MPDQPYRNPKLVETVVGALARQQVFGEGQGCLGEDMARAALARGVYTCRIFWALYDDDPKNAGLILQEVLNNSDDFLVSPTIGHVRGVKLRIKGLELYTDNDILRDDRLPLLRLLPPSLDPESALVRLLTANPDSRKEKDAWPAIKQQFPDFSRRAFDQLWPIARRRSGLPAKAPPGAKRKTK
jgi:hypothetical protein